MTCCSYWAPSCEAAVKHFVFYVKRMSQYVGRRRALRERGTVTCCPGYTDDEPTRFYPRMFAFYSFTHDALSFSPLSIFGLLCLHTSSETAPGFTHRWTEIPEFACLVNEMPPQFIFSEPNSCGVNAPWKWLQLIYKRMEVSSVVTLSHWVCLPLNNKSSVCVFRFSILSFFAEHTYEHVTFFSLYFKSISISEMNLLLALRIICPLLF